MKEQEIIKELNSIITYSEMLQEKAGRLRKKLERINVLASRKRAGLSDEEIAKVIAKRRNFLNKKTAE